MFSSRNGLSGPAYPWYHHSYVNVRELPSGPAPDAKILLDLMQNSDMLGTTVAGAVLSHCMHWVSSFIVHDTVSQLDRVDSKPTPVPLLAAFLHIICPAGVFLSAPYSESLFSAWNNLGFCLYVRAIMEESSGLSMRRAMLIVGSGLCIGLAALTRSNGLLGGLVFLMDAVLTARTILLQGSSGALVSKLFALLCGGSLIALGFAVPQVVAYAEYCVNTNVVDLRPWCRRLPPSIYIWVQDRYW